MVKFITSTDFISESFMEKAEEIAEDILKDSVKTHLNDLVPLMLLHLGAAITWKDKTLLQWGSKELNALSLINVSISKESIINIADCLDVFGTNTAAVSNVLFKLPMNVNISRYVDFNEIFKLSGKYMITDCEAARFMMVHFLHAIAIEKPKEITERFLDKFGLIIVGNFMPNELSVCQKFVNVLLRDEVTDNGKMAEWYSHVCNVIKRIVDTENKIEKEARGSSLGRLSSKGRKDK